MGGGDSNETAELKKQLEAQKAEAAAAQVELERQQAEFNATLSSEEGGAALVARRQLQAKLAAQAANMNSLSTVDTDNGVNKAMEQQRVGRIMARVGWPRKRVGGRDDREYVYVRPDTEEAAS